jgi:BirA family transcriptional regulator, biotin operon repressor / biotin---[acetyl-CoA-carboxylase] ligase
MTPREEWHLDTQRLGRRVLVYDCCDSTSTRVEALASDTANDGVVVLAREQDAGRGQYGRTWTCPSGAGVLMSVLLFPPPALNRAPILIAWAAVSVCELIKKVTSLETQIKWPNDILLGGKKVCGILIEQGQGTVAGIGLNLNQPASLFAAADLPLATSLAIATGQTRECEEVARQLIVELDAQYERLWQGDLETLESRWKWRLGLVGKRVKAECAHNFLEGTLGDVGFDGVKLTLADGNTIRLRPEAVRHFS